jgi:hypothetical protein
MEVAQVALAIGDSDSDFAAHSTNRKNFEQCIVDSNISTAVHDFSAVCLWVFVGLMLSILASASSFGVDIAAALAVAE